MISVSGTGCSEDGRPYERAGVSLVNRSFDTRYQYYPIKEDGTWEGQFLVPSEAPPGSYKLSAMCQASDMVFDVPDQTFEVSEAASAPEPQAPSPTPKLVVPKARSSPSPPPPSSPSQPPPSMAEIATSSSPTPLVKAVPDSDDDVGLYPLVPLGIAAVALIVLLVSMVLRRRRSGKAADAVG